MVNPIRSIRPAIVRTAAALCAAVLLPAAASAGQITLVWDPSPGVVAGYVVYYGTVRGGPYTFQVDVGNVTTAVVTGLTNAVRYYFVVRAYSASKLFSDPSNEVNGLPGTTLHFTDDPLLPGVHYMKAQHLTELRGHVDALRKARVGAPYPWSTAIAPGMMIRASHIVELQNAVRQELQARKVAVPPLDTPAAGSSIRASHITQIRNALALIAD